MIQNYLATQKKRCWEIYSNYYDNKHYRNHEEQYLDEIRGQLTAESILLDAGCGADMPFTKLVANRAKLAVGTDIGDLGTDRGTAVAVRADLNHLPFKDGTFDLITSMSVMEHLQDPEVAVRELSRVLKPGALAIFQTPNKYDYVSIVARITPTWFHKRVLLQLLDRKEEDTFPTYFNANSKNRIISLLRQSNLLPLKVVLFNQYPAYLMFSSLLFRLGILYERITSRFDVFAQLRAWILVVAKKNTSEIGKPLF